MSVRRSFFLPAGRVGSAVALTLVGSLATLEPTAAQGHGEHALGTVRFPVSCAPAVQADFDRAVALLHHMMYVEARQAFEAIAAKDAGCAMAHWGIATTLFQPLWPARPGPAVMKQGWEHVQHAKGRTLGSPQERALVAATEAFFQDPETADWWTRIRRWADAMEAAYRADSQHVETAALFALSRLAAAPRAENRMAEQARAAEVLLRIYEKHPTHPGAIHYTIHANDVDGRADISLPVVRSYDEIAPSVPHALHMPTHIFVRLGAWPEVIEWNRKSADAALRFPAGDATSLHYPHALDYLVYAYLQRGEDGKAKAVLDEAKQTARYQEDFISAFHLAAMPARYAVERRAWSEAAALTSRRPDYLAWDRYWWAEALSWSARGLGLVHAGDVTGAREAEARLGQLKDAAANAGERDFATYIEVDRRILAGWLAKAEGRPDSAVALMRSAAELERTVQKHPVTPGALLPASEALGDLLLSLNRPAEALAAYVASLRVWPERFNSVLGAARAARNAGDVAAARKHYAALLELVRDAQTERPAVREARDFVQSAASGR